MIKIICVIILSTLLSACSTTDDKDNINFFGGKGQLNMLEDYNVDKIYYDDANIYFIANQFNNHIINKIDSENNIQNICDDTGCEHNNKNCKANFEYRHFFTVDNDLYEINRIYLHGILTSVIYRVNDKERVFTVTTPSIDERDPYQEYGCIIDNVNVVNNQYIYVSCFGFVYLLDTNFNIILWHDNVGKSDWCMIKDKKYYYVNNFNEIMVIDMNTLEETYIELKDYISYCIDNDEKYFYFTNGSETLCRASMDTLDIEVLCKDVIYFYLGSEYIYFIHGSIDNPQAEKEIIIMDKSGNIINKIDNSDNKYEYDKIREINGKIYVFGKESLLNFDKDGRNMKEYLLEQ